MERLDRHKTLTVNLDVHAVHERHRIVLFKTPFQPSIELSAHTFNHAADAGPGTMPAVYLAEDIPYLFLRKPPGIREACESVTFLFLATQDGEYPGMDVAVSVARHA